MLQDYMVGQVLKARIYQKVKQLMQQKYEFSVRWVSSHCKVEENKRANKGAKEAARRKKIQTVR